MLADKVVDALDAMICTDRDEPHLLSYPGVAFKLTAAQDALLELLEELEEIGEEGSLEDSPPDSG